MKSEREETNMYLLMNKDKEIMQFNTLAGPLGNSYEIISQMKISCHMVLQILRNGFQPEKVANIMHT